MMRLPAVQIEMSRRLRVALTDGTAPNLLPALGEGLLRCAAEVKAWQRQQQIAEALEGAGGAGGGGAAGQGRQGGGGPPVFVLPPSSAAVEAQRQELLQLRKE
jgi:hypothetical protein